MKKYVLLLLFIFIFPCISNADRFCEFKFKSKKDSSICYIDLDKIIGVSKNEEEDFIRVYTTIPQYGFKINYDYDCFKKLLKDKTLNCEDFKCKNCCCKEGD